MEKLFKGRYLIALYDSDDCLVDVGLNPLELAKTVKRPHTLYENISKGCETLYGYKVHLIDCLEKHNDIFAEEDELFLQTLDLESVDEKLERIAKELGISKRTAYRWRYNGKLKGF